jgi:branched-chain amino acid transport system permease protein
MGDLKYLFFGLALVVMMIFRPEGLFPARQQLLAYGRAARNLLAKPGALDKEPAK